MRFFIVIAALLMAGCESKSIHSTYLQMKQDLNWVALECNKSGPVNVVYKGAFARISTTCVVDGRYIDWRNEQTASLESKGWIQVFDDVSSRGFCHSITGVYLKLAKDGRTNEFDPNKYVTVSFPEGYCYKYRPHPYQPLNVLEPQVNASLATTPATNKSTKP